MSKIYRTKKRKRVLVVYKKDAYQQYVQEQQDPHLVRLLKRGHPDLRDMQRAHDVHEQALSTVVHALRQLPVDFDLACRVDLRVHRRYHLIVTVGGDGTFLQAARSASNTPILGVNSDPSRSEAVFSAATKNTFPALCRLSMKGCLPEVQLYRLQLRLNGRWLPHRAVNDVLIVHDDPATMSRYRIQIGSLKELQKSSGVWVSTAAGSSSAVRAAGGYLLPWHAKKFQYRPRELYEGRLSRARLRGGVLSSAQRVKIHWLMRRGSIFIDGPHLRIPLRFADEVELRLSLSEPVRLITQTKTPAI
ncbi:MAG: NAD(+)/NADH kinase [Candidatus Omnitrophica bacterium]|nr:NAD(+)/NADH kinase [Candidatus Omnitrophota bacterium]MBI3010725.1 NAD(+)/NADH kinase [Candidatus Omnitrophota bacterium]